jgi:hypothetical protein
MINMVYHKKGRDHSRPFSINYLRSFTTETTVGLTSKHSLLCELLQL